MVAKWANGVSSARRRLGASSARVVLALSASSLLTLFVAAPMAYQAHSARQESPVVTPTTAFPPSVLGTSTIAPTTVGGQERQAPPTTSSSPTEFASPPETTTTVAGSTRPGGRTTTSDDGAGSGSGSVPRLADPPSSPSSPTTTIPTSPTTTIPPVPTTNAPPTTQAPEPDPASEGLYFSVVAVLQPSQELHEAELSSPVFVFADVADVANVVFSLDGEVTSNESFAPWELFGGLPLIPAVLESGEHMVQADITMTDGSAETRAAVFTVPE